MRILGNPKINASNRNGGDCKCNRRRFSYSLFLVFPGYSPSHETSAHSPFAVPQGEVPEERGHSGTSLLYLAQARLGEIDAYLISEFVKNRLVQQNREVSGERFSKILRRVERRLPAGMQATHGAKGRK